MLAKTKISAFIDRIFEGHSGNDTEDDEQKQIITFMKKKEEEKEALSKLRR